jgi:hypothetical protein
VLVALLILQVEVLEAVGLGLMVVQARAVVVDGEHLAVILETQVIRVLQEEKLLH